MTKYSDVEIVPNEAVYDGAGGEPQLHSASSYVLVVDDASIVRDFLTRCLEGWGYAVRQADSAAEALEIMVAKPASVVLCDIKMPGHDGLWLADRLHAHWPNTPLVMVTALDDLETVRQSRDCGAVDFITKPINPDQLRDILRRVTTTSDAGAVKSEPPGSPPAEFQALHEKKIEAEYTLESPVRCPACGERMATIKAIRLIRAHVNFTSTLPRRGRVLACPHCMAVVPAELSNF